jgi:hypothetical protein
VGLERGPLSLVSTTEELLGSSSSGSGLENREYGRGDPLRWQRDNAITSPTSGSHSVGLVRLRTKATEFACYSTQLLQEREGGFCFSRLLERWLLFRELDRLLWGVRESNYKPPAVLTQTKEALRVVSFGGGHSRTASSFSGFAVTSRWYGMSQLPHLLLDGLAFLRGSVWYSPHSESLWRL